MIVTYKHVCTFGYCYVVLLGQNVKKLLGQNKLLFNAFESDYHLSQSFETLETKAEYKVKDQWMGNIL